jgi:PAS domain S-box-containing protein
MLEGLKMIEAQDNRQFEQVYSKLERYKGLIEIFRQVSRLSASARSNSEFLQKTVDSLIENNCYFNVWLAVFSDEAEDKIGDFAWAIKDVDKNKFENFFEKRSLPDCYFEAQKSVEKFTVRQPEKDCAGCFLAGIYPDCSGFCKILGDEERELGFLVVSLPREFAENEEEKNLFRDIADRIFSALLRIRGLFALRSAEKAIKENEERFRLLAEVTVEGILLHKNGLAIDLNSSLAQMFGFSREELLNRNFMDFVHPDDVAKVKKELAKPVTSPYVIRMRRRNGNYFYAEIEARDYQIEGDKFRATAIRDISERIKSEEALRESESRFQKMLGVVPDMISIHDCEMNILYSNWQGFANVPPEKRIKNSKCYKTYRDFDDICPDCRARQVLLSKKAFREEAELPNGQVVDLRVIPFLNERGEVEMFMEWVRDITEQRKIEESEKKLQEQLVHAQKLESVGRLAGGVAHDFNNMLSVILGQAEIALLDLEKEHPLRSTLEEILKAGQRSADLTRQLLAFARKQTIIPKVFELNEAVDGTLKMLRRLIGEDIELIWKPSAVACMIKMDPTQLDQILANLCVNARDAISGKGKIVIQADIVEIDQLYSKEHPEIIPGKYCQMMVSDDGSGMSKETLENIFDPFFTTNESGAGTGLGLATVYGIVKQNYGFINVYSEPGFGSCFKILLPLAISGEKVSDTREPESDLQKAKEKTVLVVEDEATILAIAVSMLNRLGYRSFAASNAAEALAIVSEMHIDVLLTDVIMPNCQGPEIAGQLVKIQPGLKVVFMSGYTADAVARHGFVEDGVNFLQKPFSLKDLAEVLKNALDKN